MTLLGLLQELHLQYTLLHIPIFTTEEAKQGQKLHVSCCPICAYIVKNDSTFLNHIVIMHYWCNYACGRCLGVVVTSTQQMKKHFLKYHGITDALKKPNSQGSTGDGGQLGRAASHQSHTMAETLAPSPKRTRVTDAAMRKRVIRLTG